MNKKDYINNIEDAERRFVYAPVILEERQQGDVKESVIEGYALKFNSETTIGNYFREEILPGAVDEVLMDDVRCLFNHDPNYVLARSKEGKGTLKLVPDAIGLKYSYVTPNRSYAKDLEDAIRTEDVSQSSFAFSIEEENWIERDGELPIRQIKKLKRLYDVSPVTYSAYADATVGKRSLEAMHKAKETEVVEPEIIESKNEQKKEQNHVREAQLLIYKYQK